MTDKNVVMCADSDSLQDPRFVGLDGEDLESQKWLRVFCSALEARKYLRSSQASEEVWVASSDDIDSINLAATLKKDVSKRDVYLLAFDGSGSLKSRAAAAGINGTLSKQDFLKRYAERKCNRMAQENMLFQIPFEQQSPFDDNPAQAQEAVKQGPIQQEASQSRPDIPRVVIPAEGTSGKQAHVLTVVSASGGTGKSTIAVLAATLSQSIGHRTLLIDADLQFGDMSFLLRADKPLTVDQVVADHSLISRLVPEQGRPALLAAPLQLEQSETVGPKLCELLDSLKNSFDVIVINTGAFWVEQHISLLERSSTALFLVDQHPSSLRACKHALDLCTRCGIATHPFLFAINHCARNAPLSSIDASCALNGAHVVELQEGGREVTDLLAAGLPLELIAAHNPLTKSVERVMSEVLPASDRASEVNGEVKSDRKMFKWGRKRRRVACL